jgi:hypothetical protein
VMPDLTKVWWSVWFFGITNWLLLLGILLAVRS